jgi:hypothetical protein
MLEKVLKETPQSIYNFKPHEMRNVLFALLIGNKHDKKVAVEV